MFSLRYLFVCVYADIAPTCGCEPETNSREPHHSPPFIFETGLSMNMRLMHWLNRLADELRDLPTYLCCPSTRVTDTPHQPHMCDPISLSLELQAHTTTAGFYLWELGFSYLWHQCLLWLSCLQSPKHELSISWLLVMLVSLVFCAFYGIAWTLIEKNFLFHALRVPRKGPFFCIGKMHIVI